MNGLNMTNDKAIADQQIIGIHDFLVHDDCPQEDHAEDSFTIWAILIGLLCLAGVVIFFILGTVRNVGH
jgi:hypothetical protein